MTRLRSRLARPVVGLAAATAAIAGVTAVANPQSASAAGTPVSSTAALAGQPPASLAVDEDGNTVLGAASTVSPASVADQYIVQVEDAASLTDVVADVTADGVAITNTLDGAIDRVHRAARRASTAAELREVRRTWSRSSATSRYELSGCRTAPRGAWTGSTSARCRSTRCTRTRRPVPASTRT